MHEECTRNARGLHVAKQTEIKSFELVGGPFCGVLVVPAKQPEPVLILSVEPLRGLIDPDLEKRYEKRRVLYQIQHLNGTRAVYRCTGNYLEVGSVKLAEG
jgi:hypothetical protein